MRPSWASTTGWNQGSISPAGMPRRRSASRVRRRWFSQLGVEGRPAAPAPGLDPVEGHVGEALQVAGLGGVVREHRHPDRGARRDLAAIDRVRPGEQVQELLGAAGGVGGVGDQGELVAAQPGHQFARAGGAAQPLAHLGQEEIAGVVAERVVEQLEAVQVDDEERHLAAVGPGGLQPLAELGGEGAAIDQAGQRVGLGQPHGERALRLQLDDARLQVAELLGAVGHGRKASNRGDGWA
jgi:hypothetical protein